MPAPDEVIALIERFEEHYESYRRPTYNETQLRREFVDPLFMTLGWDVNNEQGHAEAYKEVIHEDSLQVGGATKAPDYSFRIGPVRKFFVETKKPSVNIRENTRPAFQLRRYGWSAKLPLCVLTDFEEFAVYDTRIRPTKDDAASTARVLYLRYTDYTERWDDIAGIFSREAILRGAFDKYADSKKRKRGTAEVDEAFLQEIEEWRTLLAREIALRNVKLSQREVNTAVQNTIDRIIFLRICEDRGIEKYGRLQALLNGGGIYRKLGQLFQQADERYNSGLFHFTNEKDRNDPPDEWTLGLTIEDKPLKQILQHLYYPDSPYEFSVLGADILGQVYEQFLGKVIVLTPSHRAKIEEKPEVRKAGGVYYTPTYIVDYIVQQTVGELVKDKQPHEVAGRTKKTFKPATGKHPLTVLDPACGSGSFLIGAYQFLLDWYLQQYVEAGPEKVKDRVYQVSSDTWRLTTAERKRILLDHIYGVDIDAQAVEVTKLSLLLKVLEGENRQSLERQLTMFRQRALPDLSKNIKCGNSLIGPDFYDNRQLELYDEEELYRINAFDWDAEFAGIMGRGGFDAVIGNPPYVLMQVLNQPDVFEYFSECYQSAAYKIDTYHLFLELSTNVTCDDGYLGFITPNSYFRNKHAIALRRLLLEETSLERLVLFQFNVFAAASVDTAVTIAKRWSSKSESHEVTIEAWTSPTERRPYSTPLQSKWLERDALNFEVSGRDGFDDIAASIETSGIALGEFATAYFGIQTYDRTTFVADVSCGKLWKPALDGSNIERYLLHPPIEWVNTHVDAIKSGGKRAVYEADRIGIRQIGKHPIATLLPGGWYSLNTIYNLYFLREVPFELTFILGVLNSRLMQWYWEFRFFDHKRTFPKIKKAPLLSIPIAKAAFEAESAAVRDVTEKVDRILMLRAELADADPIDRRTLLQRQIAAIDKQIDGVIYQMYALPDDEIRLVEEATR